MSWIMNPDGTGIPRNQDDQEEKVGATEKHSRRSTQLNIINILLQVEDYSGRKVSNRAANQPFLSYADILLLFSVVKLTN